MSSYQNDLIYTSKTEIKRVNDSASQLSAGRIILKTNPTQTYMLIDFFLKNGVFWDVTPRGSCKN
jgi:hypothetical protein